MTPVWQSAERESLLWRYGMSAIAHIKTALPETVFAAPRVKVALDQLIDSLDEDLDRLGYRPSTATQARLQQLLRVAGETGAGAAPEDEEEELRDTQRLS
jgi:hypothetical protein